MKRTGSALRLTLLLLLAPAAMLAQHAGPSDQFRQQALEKIAENNARNFHFVAAKLRTGHDTTLAWRQLDTLLSAPTGDMFWTYPATAFYFYCNDLLDQEWKERFRSVWKDWTPYRGDTENHFLMYYQTLYLMAQEWPGLPGSEWFNGKSSSLNFAEAEEYLNGWIDETVTLGQTEWDSPRYFYFYLLPLLTLYDHAEDKLLARRAGMMVEYLLADYAVDYLEGRYCGAHSRDGDGSVIDPMNAEARSWSDFYWEDTLDLILPDLAFGAMSNFRCPSIIRDIAHDRDTSFMAYERKRSRAKMRFSEERFTPVLRKTWMTPSYAIGSIGGGLQQPIQQHSWDITFAGERDNRTIFALNPHASALELGTFFPEEPELMEAGILGSKASYGSPDKWVGGSPYEEIRQHERTLFGHYTIPEGARFDHVDFFLPKLPGVDQLQSSRGNWHLHTVTDLNLTIAIRVDRCDSAAWIEEESYWRLRLYGGEIDYTVIAGVELAVHHPVEELNKVATRDSAFAHRENPYEHFLFNTPHLRSKLTSGVLKMSHGNQRRTLDFIRNEVREE